jgi:hypothetical protein
MRFTLAKKGPFYTRHEAMGQLAKSDMRLWAGMAGRLSKGEKVASNAN